MAWGAHTAVMHSITPLIHDTMRRSLVGALATDPVLADRRRLVRRPRRDAI